MEENKKYDCNEENEMVMEFNNGVVITINEIDPILMQEEKDFILEKKKHAFAKREKMKKAGRNLVVVIICMPNILAMTYPLLNQRGELG